MKIFFSIWCFFFLAFLGLVRASLIIKAINSSKDVIKYTLTVRADHKGEAYEVYQNQLSEQTLNPREEKTYTFKQYYTYTDTPMRFNDVIFQASIRIWKTGGKDHNANSWKELRGMPHVFCSMNDLRHGEVVFEIHKCTIGSKFISKAICTDTIVNGYIRLTNNTLTKKIPNVVQNIINMQLGIPQYYTRELPDKYFSGEFL